MKATGMPIVMVAATILAGPLAGQEGVPLGRPVGGAVPCTDALLADGSVAWLARDPLVADFTLDGRDDVVLWGVQDGQLVIRVARCAGADVASDWRYPFAPEAACDAGEADVTAGSLLMEPRIVERVCARGEGRSECIHLRRENARRRALMARGGRAISVVAPACLAMDLVWDEHRQGFMRMPR